MAKGPFGNPLSTGIALSGVIDMTPYRQMHARKMKKLEDEKKEKKRKKKELAGILSKVTLDEDKIFWRQHDNAKIKYADTIDKITTMYNNEDYSGMYKTMNDFSMDMGNLMQENAVIKARDVQIAKGNVYYDPAVEAMKNNRDVSNEDYGLALEETGYGDISENGIYNYIALQELVDENKLVNDYFKNVDRQVMFDKSGNPLNVMGKSDNTRYLRNEIPEQILNQGIASIASNISKNKLQELAYFRSKKFPVNDLAGMSPADQMAKKQEWYMQSLGDVASGIRYGQTTDPIQAAKTTTESRSDFDPGTTTPDEQVVMSQSVTTTGLTPENKTKYDKLFDTTLGLTQEDFIKEQGEGVKKLEPLLKDLGFTASATGRANFDIVIVTSPDGKKTKKLDYDYDSSSDEPKRIKQLAEFEEWVTTTLQEDIETPGEEIFKYTNSKTFGSSKNIPLDISKGDYIEKADGTVVEVDFDRKNFPVEILKTFVDDNTGEVIYEVNMFAKEEPDDDGNLVFTAMGSLNKDGEYENIPSKTRLKAYIRDSEAKRQFIKTKLGVGTKKIKKMSNEDFYNDYFIAPLGKGSSSSTSSGKKIEGTKEQFEKAAKDRGMSIDEYKDFYEKQGIEVIIK